MEFLTEKLQIKSTKYLQDIVENYNSKLSSRNKKEYPECTTINDKMIDKCQTLQFYLNYLNILMMTPDIDWRLKNY